MRKLNIAIIGQGRSGKDIHGNFYLSPDNLYYNVKYVVEADARRRELSKTRYEGCKVFTNYQELFDCNDIDLVVNASFSHMHYPITKDLLNHKFNVLCEKPFVRNRYECDELMKLARDKNVVLAVFQQTFFAPFYRDILRVLSEGLIGDIIQVNIRYNNFARRWDWQTLQKKMAGSAFNTGPHPFGIALGVMDFDKDAKIAFSRLVSTPLSSGDSDDYCKLILTAPNRPVVDVEISSIDAFTDYNVKLQGTRGTFKCTPTHYEYKYIVDGENLARPVVDSFLQDNEGNPLYCSEKLITHEGRGDYGGTAFDVGTAGLYENLYYAITEGKPLYVTMEMERHIVSLIEQIYAANPMTLKY